MHTSIRTYVHTYMHTYIPTYIHTYIHLHIHTYILYTFICIYIYFCILYIIHTHTHYTHTIYNIYICECLHIVPHWTWYLNGESARWAVSSRAASPRASAPPQKPRPRRVASPFGRTGHRWRQMVKLLYPLVMTTMGISWGLTLQLSNISLSKMDEHGPN